jgi:hypothetical protein
MHHDRLLGRSQDSLQAMCSVGAIVKGLALLPLVRSLLGNTVALCQDAGGLLAGSNLGTHGGRGACVLVQGNQHGLAHEVENLSRRTP